MTRTERTGVGCEPGRRRLLACRHSGGDGLAAWRVLAAVCARLRAHFVSSLWQTRSLAIQGCLLQPQLRPHAPTQTQGADRNPKVPRNRNYETTCERGFGVYPRAESRGPKVGGRRPRGQDSCGP
jgi:hypothetical protein